MRRSPWLLLAFLAFGVHAGPGTDSEKAELDADTVLLKLGPAEITLREFDAALTRVPEDKRNEFASDPERIGTFLEQLARQELLSARAREHELHKREEVQARVDLAKQRVLSQAMLEEVRETAEPADYEQQAREYYLTNPDEFQRPETVSVSHILIREDERTEDEAADLARKVARKARSGEAPFEDLVAEYSEDPSAARNAGRLSDIERGDTVEPFENAAFSLEEPGEVAGPVKTEFGHHVIRLEERTPAGKRDFEEVKTRLVKQMKDRHLGEVRDKYLSDLMTEHEPDADEATIRALRERYSQQEQPVATDPN